MIACQLIPFPCGEIAIYANHDQLTEIIINPHDKVNVKGNAITNKAADQLNEYFSGKRKTFNLPFQIIGSTFQQAVWQALQQIPYGATTHYADIAIKIGKPKASQAVGQANKRNQFPIIIPCHRVIAKDGRLSGFNYKPEVKAFLIELEAKSN